MSSLGGGGRGPTRILGVKTVMTIDEIYALPVDDDGWRILRNGYRVKLGDGVTLGTEVRLGSEGEVK